MDRPTEKTENTLTKNMPEDKTFSGRLWQNLEQGARSGSKKLKFI